MGRRGPAPKPTALRLLHGDRKDRINEREPVARDTLPELPDNVSGEVRQVWEYTLGELQVMRCVAAADRDSLLAYCEAVVVHRKASAVLAKTPVLVKGIHGNMVRNPALQIQRDAAQTIRAFAQEFGLTPSGRTRIQTEATHGERENPFAAVG